MLCIQNKNRQMTVKLNFIKYTVLPITKHNTTQTINHMQQRSCKRKIKATPFWELWYRTCQQDRKLSFLWIHGGKCAFVCLFQRCNQKACNSKPGVLCIWWSHQKLLYGTSWLRLNHNPNECIMISHTCMSVINYTKIHLPAPKEVSAL